MQAHGTGEGQAGEAQLPIPLRPEDPHKGPRTPRSAAQGPEPRGPPQVNAILKSFMIFELGVVLFPFCKGPPITWSPWQHMDPRSQEQPTPSVFLLALDTPHGLWGDQVQGHFTPLTVTTGPGEEIPRSFRPPAVWAVGSPPL